MAEYQTCSLRSERDPWQSERVHHHRPATFPTCKLLSNLHKNDSFCGSIANTTLNLPIARNLHILCESWAHGKLGLYRADTIRIKTRVMMRFGSVYDVPISLRACINIIIIRGLVIIPTQTDWRCLLIRDHYKECLIHAIDLVWSKVSSLLVDFEIVRFKIDNLHHMCNEVVPC